MQLVNQLFICNVSLNQSIYPNRFKFTIVELIYKKGGKTASTHFTINNFLKDIRKVMYNRLSPLLYVAKTVTAEKFDFQKNSNTVQQFIC